MIVTTAIDSYVLDSYPGAPGEHSVLTDAGRMAGEFIFSDFETTWAEAEGKQKSLGIQAAVVGAAFLVFIVPFQILGKNLKLRGREKWGSRSRRIVAPVRQK